MESLDIEFGHQFTSSCHQVTKSNTSPEELGPLANQLTSDYGRLASQAKPAAVAAENEEVTSPAPDTKPKAYPLSHDVSLWGCPTLGHSGLS